MIKPEQNCNHCAWNERRCYVRRWNLAHLGQGAPSLLHRHGIVHCQVQPFVLYASVHMLLCCSFPSDFVKPSCRCCLLAVPKWEKNRVMWHYHGSMFRSLEDIDSSSMGDQNWPPYYTHVFCLHEGPLALTLSSLLCSHRTSAAAIVMQDSASSRIASTGRATDLGHLVAEIDDSSSYFSQNTVNIAHELLIV
jgi:hypothetical protein